MKLFAVSTILMGFVFFASEANAQSFINWTQPAQGFTRAEGLEVRYETMEFNYEYRDQDCIADHMAGWGDEDDDCWRVENRVTIQFCNRTRSEWRGVMKMWYIRAGQEQAANRDGEAISRFIGRFPQLDMRVTPGPRIDPDNGSLLNNRFQVPPNSCETRRWRNPHNPQVIRVMLHRVQTPYDHIYFDPAVALGFW